MELNFINIFLYSISPELHQTLLPVKFIFLGVSLLIVAFLIFALLRTNWLQLRFLESIVHLFTSKPYGTKHLTKSWTGIIKKLDEGRESEYKLAVVQADTMISEAFKRAGYKGKDLEDLVGKLSKSVLSNNAELIKAHKTRNEVVANPDYKLSLDETKKLLNVYQRTLTDLGLL